VIRLLDKIYLKVGVPQLVDFISQAKVPIKFVVEAGCHDGTDTLKFLESMGIQKVYAFEPDPIARVEAQKNLEVFLNSKVFLSASALSNRNRPGEIIFGDVEGNGTSQVLESKSDNSMAIKIDMVCLDDVSIVETENGFLWLDVEGHAVAALEGAKKSLAKIDLAKIEVQMHAMGVNRPADAFEVIALCRQAGLVPIYLPIHPGFFGDIYFIRQTKTGRQLRLLGCLRFFVFLLLHKWIYPLLGKPRFN